MNIYISVSAQLAVLTVWMNLVFNGFKNPEAARVKWKRAEQVFF